DLAGIGIPVDSKNMFGQEITKFHRLRENAIALAYLLFDQFTVALHEENAGAARGIENAHARLQWFSYLHLVEHEVHEGHGRVVRAATPPLGSSRFLVCCVKELFVDDRERLDGDE